MIKNIIFDIGNVVVRWAPLEIMRLTFGDGSDVEQKAQALFNNEIWLALNKGLISEEEATTRYKDELGLSPLECSRFFYYVKHSQIQIYGTVDLIKRLKTAGYGIYAITDNINEIVAHLRATYTFWDLFDGATVSAEVGLLKPSPEIYQSLLSTNQLTAAESVFIDDVEKNVNGAKAVGMAGVQFVNADQCEKELLSLGIILSES